METFSIWRLIEVLLIWVVFFVIPVWRILRKAGFPGAWSLLSIVPLLNIIALWVFAFITWPSERSGA
jgi:hypothetical protein